jgi:hypothetical protein
MKKNAETGELEVFHSKALADDLPSEDEDEGDAGDEMGGFLDGLDSSDDSD